MGTNYIPAPVQELETPKMEPVQFNPPPSAPVPQGAGFAGTGTAVLNIADKFINGWMAGKYLKEQRMQKQAATQIGAADSSVKVAGAVLQNVLREGDDPRQTNIPPEKWTPEQQKYVERLDQARQALTSAWTSKVSLMKKYVDPTIDENGQPIKKSLGAKVKGAVLPQGPELYQQMAIKALEGSIGNIDPHTGIGSNVDALIAQISPQEKAARAVARGVEARETTDATIRGLRDSLAKNIAEIAKETDPGKKKALQTEQETIQGQIAAYGQSTNIPRPGESALRDASLDEQVRIMQKRKTAMDKLAKGVDITTLPQDEQIALNGKIADQELGAYLRNVKSDTNPNGIYPDELAARAAYRSMVATTSARVQATPFSQFRDSYQNIVQHSLQNPEEAKKWGLPRPLREGEDAPAWIVDTLAMQEFNKKYEGKPPRPTEGDVKRAQRGLTSAYLVANPDDSRFIDAYLQGQSPTSTFGEKWNPFANSTQQNYAGFQQRFNEFLRSQKQEPEDVLRESFPGLYMGSDLRNGYGVGQAAPSPTATFAPPPGGGLAPNPKGKWYTVTIDGKTKDMQFTDDGIQKAKAAQPGATFTPKTVTTGTEAAPAPTPAAKPAYGAPVSKATVPTSDNGIPSDLNAKIARLREIDPDTANKAVELVADLVKNPYEIVSRGRTESRRNLSAEEVVDRANKIITNHLNDAQRRKDELLAGAKQVEDKQAKEKKDKQVLEGLIKSLSNSAQKK